MLTSIIFFLLSFSFFLLISLVWRVLSFEKAMLSRLLSFLDAKELLYGFQFGFRASQTTEHAWAAFSNFIHSAIDSGHIPAALFLDVRKALKLLIL